MTLQTEPSVAVIGGGIAGIQAALDLADMGITVYLVERSPAIGGRMAQLDKTFPTNDCAICILAPKMADCARHPRIKMLTCHDVRGLSGKAGGFRLVLHKRSRYVDPKKCTACGDCTKACPVEVPNLFDENLSTRKVIYKQFAQAVPGSYVVDKKGVPFCIQNCPAGVNAQGYVALIRQRRFTEALALEKKRNPLPLVCGRVCLKPCESECRRGDVDQPVDIRALKRFIADYELKAKKLPKPETAARKGKKVAIVGSGPAGLTAAYDLALLGYDVTIFEALSVAGGMLAVGIPAYRLPRAVLEAEIEAIRDLGVEIKLNSPVGAPGMTLEDLKNQGYQAFFLATGAHKSVKLNIPGEDATGVAHCGDFLRDANLGMVQSRDREGAVGQQNDTANSGKKVEVGRRVAVIGGGNAAIDCARVAWRLGAEEVTIVYRRSMAEMPADRAEINEGVKEGVRLEVLAAPVAVIVEDGKVSRLRCVRMRLGEPDASGRRAPIPIDGWEFTMDIDMVIAAIGQTPDLGYVGKTPGVNVTRRGTIAVDADTLATEREGVFAGGDAVLGPATVVKAIAAGKEVAVSIDRHLSGQDVKADRKASRLRPLEKEEVPIEHVPRKNRIARATVPVEQRRGNFTEVESGFTEDEAVAEAGRCLSCGPCCECRECEKVCQPKAIVHDEQDASVELEVESIVVATGLDTFDLNTMPEFGLGKIKNVFSAMEFERISCASGPTAGHIVRRSDHREPRSLAFIQCVASRDVRYSRYCSSVCCMHSTKEAMISREHIPGIHSYIFYTEFRAVGKWFQEYRRRAEETYGITYIRGRVFKIEEDEAANPVVCYEDTETGRIGKTQVDMAILATALLPSKGTVELAGMLSLELDEFNFIRNDPLSPTDTPVSGIFVCGYCRGPTDIPEAVAQASAAAARAAEWASKARSNSCAAVVS